MLTCGNNNCVTTSSVCDGVDDCGDFTDELSCTSREYLLGYTAALKTVYQ